MDLNQEHGTTGQKTGGLEDERLMMKTLFPQGTLTVHVGQSHAPWTQLLRVESPNAEFREIDPATPIDSWRRTNRIAHLQHAVVQDFAMLPNVIAGARETLAHARIDMLHFRVPEGHDLSALAARLRRDGYIPFRSEQRNIQMLNGWAVFPAGYYLMVQERIVPLFLRKPGYGLDFVSQCRHQGIQVRGVVHVGAHEGQEIGIYDKMGAERVVFIEANPHVHERLAAAMKKRPNVTTVQRAISDHTGKVTLHVASFDQSSSLLPMAKHREVYPKIVESEHIEVDAAPLDALLAELDLDPALFNFLTVDVQGAELLVLKGAKELLRHIDGIDIEVNFAELYAGCAQIEDIDDFLGAAGFHRAAMTSHFHLSWGDAFYVRERPASP